MPNLKGLYHRLIPAPLRYPIGHWRRGVADTFRRWRTPGPLPPRRLLSHVQMTPWIREYLEVGRRASASIERSLEEILPATGGRPRVLDFGCGLGRVLRHFESSGWDLHGCDVDPLTVEWARMAFPWARLERTSEVPPLPYGEATFDGVYTVSVFTHFDAGQQAEWAAELARVLRPGGGLVLSTMGPRAFGSFPGLATPENRGRFENRGFFFYPGSDEERRPARTIDGALFNARGAFHTAAGLEGFFAGSFELERWTEGGLDGFQDLAIFRRRQEVVPEEGLEPTRP